MELKQEDRDELARLISEGCNGGRLDAEDYNITWTLKTDKWEVE